MIGEWWEVMTDSERWIGKVSRDLGRETFVVQPHTFVLADIESYVVLEP